MTKQEFFKANRNKAIAHATKNFDKLNDFCADSHRVKNLNDEDKIQEFAQICLESWFDDLQH